MLRYICRLRKKVFRFVIVMQILRKVMKISFVNQMWNGPRSLSVLLYAGLKLGKILLEVIFQVSLSYNLFYIYPWASESFVIYSWYWFDKDSLLGWICIKKRPFTWKVLFALFNKIGSLRLYFGILGNNLNITSKYYICIYIWL